MRTRLAAVVLLFSSLAHAEEPKLDYADGPSACRDFHSKNDRELAEWQKQQPAVPYKYPQDKDVLGAPWGGITENIGSQWELVLATIIPHFGAQLRNDTPAALISWPLSLPVGPAYTCSRTQGTFTVRDHKAHRALLEPGIVSSNRGVGAFVRPGYRFIYQPSDWVVGAGGGLGTTIELAGQREPTRMSLGPELVARFGHCCDPGYFTLTFRYDHYFAGDVKDIIGGSLGFVYF